MKNQPHSTLELLEARIAPAAVFVNATTATYNDNDGDHVTVHFTKPLLTAGNVGSVFSFNAAGYLALLDLTASASPDGTGVAFTVAKVAGGDGLVNVGYIKATGHDLGKVTVPGDLGQLDAGTASATIPALKSLAVRSLGRLGLDTQGNGGNLKSTIHGTLGSLKVAGDVKDAYILMDVGTAKIGSVTIGGSLIGGAGQDSGEISSFGDLGTVKIGGDVQGGTGSQSGYLTADGKMGGVTLGGSLLGGSGSNSGEIFGNADMGAVKIGGDVQGGSGADSGAINGGAKIASVALGGSLLGGTNDATGEIDASDGIGAVKIGGDLIGGSIAGLATLDSSGLIDCGGRIASITIGGSVITGTDNSTKNQAGGDLTNNAAIHGFNGIGSLTVKGSLVGNLGTGGLTPVIISAFGQSVPGPTADLAIGKITVGERVEYAQILAGYGNTLTADNADAQIGKVKVGGDWVASSIVAGARSGPFGFGAGDAKPSGAGVTDAAGLFSKIASITIAGQVFGTPSNVGVFDQFGFVAEEIGAVKIGGSAFALTAGKHNDNHTIGQTLSDMHIHEI